RAGAERRGPVQRRHTAQFGTSVLWQLAIRHGLSARRKERRQRRGRVRRNQPPLQCGLDLPEQRATLCHGGLRPHLVQQQHDPEKQPRPPVVCWPWPALHRRQALPVRLQRRQAGGRAHGGRRRPRLALQRQLLVVLRRLLILSTPSWRRARPALRARALRNITGNVTSCTLETVTFAATATSLIWQCRF